MRLVYIIRQYIILLLCIYNIKRVEVPPTRSSYDEATNIHTVLFTFRHDENDD